MIVMENADGTPLTRQDQLGQAVAVQVTPDSTANQAHLFQSARVLLVKQPASAAMMVNSRRGRLGITACNYPATLIYRGPSHSRTQLAEFSGQTGLPLKIIKLVLMMRVPQQIAGVFEEWLRWCFRRLERFPGSCFINFINPVGFHFFHDASFA